MFQQDKKQVYSRDKAEGLVMHCELRLALTSYLNSEA